MVILALPHRPSGIFVAIGDKDTQDLHNQQQDRFILTAGKGKKGKGSRRFFRAFLAVMLVLSLGNAVYIHKLIGSRQAQSLPVLEVGESGRVVTPGVTAAPARKWGPGPGWRGDINVKKGANGSDITIDALDTKGNGVPLTSYEVTVYPSGNEKEPLPVTVERETGSRIKAHVKLPEKGEAIIRVRLHRERATLEFSQRIHAE